MAGPFFVSDEILSISLRRKAVMTLEHVPFALFYSLSLYQCYLTIGVPYAAAFEKAQDEYSGLPCMPLPSEYVPSFMARLYLGTTVLLHGLMALWQHWSVNFRCWLKYPVADVRDAQWVKVLPRPHKGRAAVVELLRGTISRYYCPLSKSLSIVL